MRRLVVVLALAAVGCGRNTSTVDAGLADSGVDGGPGRPMSCVALRGCVAACGADTVCSEACVTDAPAAAQARHQDLASCSRTACPTADVVCRCETECLAPSDCEAQSDECFNGEEDTFCTVRCH